MCSCHRDHKPHTEACLKAHQRWDHSPKAYAARIRRKVAVFEKKNGVKV